jgi:hypothetical protein
MATSVELHHVKASVGIEEVSTKIVTDDEEGGQSAGSSSLNPWKKPQVDSKAANIRVDLDCVQTTL